MRECLYVGVGNNVFCVIDVWCIDETSRRPTLRHSVKAIKLCLLAQLYLTNECSYAKIVVFERKMNTLKRESERTNSARKNLSMRMKC